jgi:hypothetical protein
MRNRVTLYLHANVIAAVNAAAENKERSFQRVIENIFSAPILDSPTFRVTLILSAPWKIQTRLNGIKTHNVPMLKTTKW